ncbi:hypothetical protein C8R44DRAFT_97141 [Mycena epipterygia]|nr:hypothetical protein C8R44DRAFT_97141 [Mycena epipterygia]
MREGVQARHPHRRSAGGAILGLLSVAADLMGVIGSGAGILTTIYSYWKSAYGNPAARRWLRSVICVKGTGREAETEGKGPVKKMQRRLAWKPYHIRISRVSLSSLHVEDDSATCVVWNTTYCLAGIPSSCIALGPLLAMVESGVIELNYFLTTYCKKIG